MLGWVRNRWRGVVLAGTAVAVSGALYAGGVMAQTPPPGQGGGQAQAPIEQFIGKLASRLGITTEKLTTEMKGAQKDMVDDAVAAGKITKEAGDKAKERIDAGKGGFPHGRAAKPGRHRPGLPGLFLREGVEAVAKFLGIEPDQLKQELRAGKSLAQVAEAHGKSRQQLIDFLIDGVKARLDKAVADKKITQQRADAMLEVFKKNVEKIVDRTGPLPGPNGKPGPRGPQGGQRGPGGSA